MTINIPTHGIPTFLMFNIAKIDPFTILLAITLFKCS